jgi:hypothetical protein
MRQGRDKGNYGRLSRCFAISFQGFVQAAVPGSSARSSHQIANRERVFTKEEFLEMVRVVDQKMKKRRKGES